MKNLKSEFNSTGLDERILKAVEKSGFGKPTAIQQQVIPAALQGKDIQASSETGSGKTAAFLLPILHMMHSRPVREGATRCLILLPTRELAFQVLRHCRDLAAFTALKAELLSGGMSFKEQKAMIRRNPEIIVGTPGRIIDHLHSGSLDLSDLEFLVLDEADRMLDMGFRDDVREILATAAVARQTFLLSATLDHAGIGKIAAEVLQHPVVIDLGGRHQTNTDIQQEVILADDVAHKRNLLTWLLANEKFEKSLVFCNTRKQVDELGHFLASQNRRVYVLHGEMSQDNRKAVMARFRQGDGILVATDLAARGLDIKGTDLVINFALARSGDEHVHRVGRTGRAGVQGKAISLISPQEWNRLQSIERYLGQTFGRREIEGMAARFSGSVKKKPGKKKTARKSAASPWGSSAKAKSRHRNRKNVGKRSGSPASGGGSSSKVVSDQGFAPLKKKR